MSKILRRARPAVFELRRRTARCFAPSTYHFSDSTSVIVWPTEMREGITEDHKLKSRSVFNSFLEAKLNEPEPEPLTEDSHSAHSNSSSETQLSPVAATDSAVRAAANALKAVYSPKGSRFMRAVVVGLPNSGKSALMNRLVAFGVSATSAKVNTTRTETIGCLTAGNLQIEFADTPGILPLAEEVLDDFHNLDDGSLHAFGRVAVDGSDNRDKDRIAEQTYLHMNAWQSVHSADVVLFVVDPTRTNHERDFAIAKQLATLDSNLNSVAGDGMNGAKAIGTAEKVDCTNDFGTEMRSDLSGVIGDDTHESESDRLTASVCADASGEFEDDAKLEFADSCFEVDISRKFQSQKEAVKSSGKRSRKKRLHKVLVINKCDLLWPHDAMHKLAKQINGVCRFDVSMLVSAKKKRRISKLKGFLMTLGNSEETALKRQFEGKWKYESAVRTPMSKEQQIVELIRSKLFQRVHKEMPYVITVKLDSLEETEERMSVVASLAVEKQSQIKLLTGTAMTHLSRWTKRDLATKYGKHVKLLFRVKLKST